jgi:sugar lactone lactonase YvrE
MDHHNHRVREVDAAGNIVTVAGSGPIGQGQGSFAGDGGPAAEARLAESIGIAFDGAGNLYIADNFNHRIRRVDTGGVITTFAGNGAPSGIVPIEDGSLASEVPLANPWYLTFDAAGNLVFSDVGLGGVFRIGTDGRISRVPADVRNPNGVGFDAAGNLYIADADNQRIVKVGADGTVTTIAGTGTAGFSGDGGPGTDAEINTPFGLAVDRAGNVYFADGLNRRLRMIDTAGVITTIAGG